jgi:hypothetical protein
VRSLASWLLQQAQEVTAELIRVEANSKILDSQDSASINNGRKKRVVHITICGFQRKYAIAARHVVNDVRGAGKKKPAREVGAERPRIFLKHFGGVPLGVDRNGNESDLGAEVRAELILNKGHHRRQNGAGVGAQGIDESYGHDLAA